MLKWLAIIWLLFLCYSRICLLQPHPPQHPPTHISACPPAPCEQDLCTGSCVEVVCTASSSYLSPSTPVSSLSFPRLLLLFETRIRPYEKWMFPSPHLSPSPTHLSHCFIFLKRENNLHFFNCISFFLLFIFLADSCYKSQNSLSIVSNMSAPFYWDQKYQIEEFF